MDPSLPNKILESYWGYKEFRPLQKEIILTILEATDTVALLPTGAGKSVCYQIPSIIARGTCIVISPLLALIKDQVSLLKKKLIPAEFISSEQTPDQQISVFNKLRNNELKLLYVSPERLLNKTFLEISKDIEISFIAVEIIKKLDLTNAQVFKKSFKRENLSLQVMNIHDKLGQIERILHRYKGSGIIYCRTRNETKNVYDTLKRKGFDVDFFHAGLPAYEKIKKQKEWTDSDSKVLISTNAFGMGIDKENVRVIIHLSPPYSLENYYQEVGRAGRDGHLSHTFLLWNEQEFSDIYSSLTQTISSKSEYSKILRYLFSMFSIVPNELPENIFDFDLNLFQQRTQISKNKIIPILEFLHNSSVLQWKFEPSESLLKINFPIERLDTNFYGKDSIILEKIARKITGVFSYQIKFDEKKLAESLLIPTHDLHSMLVKYNQTGDISYIDGNKQKILFLEPRNDQIFLGKYWDKFQAIQQNKLVKYKELEFFIKNKKYCRMRLILGYFNEKSNQSCGKCDVCCESKIEGDSYLLEILNFIKKEPRSREDIYAEFQNIPFEKIHEYLQELISENRIKALNFNTYSI